MTKKRWMALLIIPFLSLQQLQQKTIMSILNTAELEGNEVGLLFTNSYITPDWTTQYIDLLSICPQNTVGCSCQGDKAFSVLNNKNPWVTDTVKGILLPKHWRSPPPPTLFFKFACIFYAGNIIINFLCNRRCRSCSHSCKYSVISIAGFNALYQGELMSAEQIVRSTEILLTSVQRSGPEVHSNILAA